MVPIKLAQGVSLINISVDYWPVSNPDDVRSLVATAEGGPGSTVAVLDTTLLANDSYVIRLRGTNPDLAQTTLPNEPQVMFVRAAYERGGPRIAENSISQEVISQVTVNVAGEYKPGRISLSTTDFTIPVAGIPITIGRTYDSLERGRIGDCGGEPAARSKCRARRDANRTGYGDARHLFIYATIAGRNF